jgi:hypothetical protein
VSSMAISRRVGTLVAHETAARYLPDRPLLAVRLDFTSR